MADAADVINQIIQNAITTANSMTTQADNAADDLVSSRAGIWVTPPTSDADFAVAAIEPTIPQVGDSKLEYDARLAELVALLSNKLADFFATYYPLQSDAFDEATAWLVDTITNGGTGINADIEEQVWQRARDRIITEGRRLSNQIQTGYAAKGHTLPQGSMLRKVEENRSDSYAKLGTASTDIAAKQLEIEIATIKFAIEEALKSRAMAMQAAADYIRAIASAPDAAARAAALDADNQARMVAAYSSWYNTRLERDRIVLSSKLAEMQSRDTIYQHRRDSATRNSSVDVQALSAAADVYARTASAALSSLNSIVSSATTTFT